MLRLTRILRCTLPVAVLSTIGVTASGQTTGPVRASPPVSIPSDSLATMLARAGYVAIPLGRTPERHYLYVDAAIDTIPIKLLLDSGYDFDLMLEPAYLPHLAAQVVNVEGASNDDWALVAGIRLGPLQLDATNVWLNRNPSLSDPSVLPEAKGLIGATLLTRYKAIVDYGTDTLYLLPPVADSARAVRRPATSSPNLLAALRETGRYRTFLALMQEAGLTPLLEDTAGRGAPTESLIWTEPRVRAHVLGYSSEDIGSRLSRPGQRTVFAPTDAAFAQLPKGMLAAFRADRAQLAGMLRAHLMTGAALDTSTIRTLFGGVSQVDGPTYGFQPRGTATEVDRLTENGRVLARARIVDPELIAGNGIAHGIDQPLVPLAEPSSLARALAQQGYIGIPMHRIYKGRYMVRAKADSASFAWSLVDTGASCDPPDETDLSLDLPFLNESPRPISLALDSVNVGQANATYIENPVFKDGYGLICIRMLTKYHSRLDFGTGTLYLRLR